MTRRQFLVASGASAGWMAMPRALRGEVLGSGDINELRRGFLDPPMSSQPWVYWWWLEGVVTKAGITADLEEMTKKGISGVLLFHAGRTGPTAVKGPEFMSEEWREFFRHSVNEAARLGMEMGVSLCSGWDAGGPWVAREDAIKILVWRELQVQGPRTLTENQLTRATVLMTQEGPLKETNPQDWYREIEVLASPAGDKATWKKDDARTLIATEKDGIRTWQVPAGEWTVMQFGYTLSGKLTSLPTYNQLGFEIDPMSAHALDQHFDHTAAILIKDAGEHAGRTFKYTHIDSWEIGQPTWTQAFAEEFKKRRGYDAVPYLPALAGKTIESTDVSQRFAYDYRSVIAELVKENYYGRLTYLSEQHGLGTHSEAGGPFYLQYVDGLACLGADTIPMGEFWSTAPRYEVKEAISDPLFHSSSRMAYDSHTGSVRQAASAARIYGKKFCQAESFTGFDRDWSEDPYYLKAYGDRAFCLGLGRIVVHHYASVPDFGNPPGNQWEHVSIHFNRYVTWWDKCHAWMKYLGRCQHLLQQGDFVADILLYAGEAVPNFVLIDRKPVAGFNFDTTNAEALLARATVRDGKIDFGSGTFYRYLVIPAEAGRAMSPQVLKKLSAMVHDGMTLIASRPERVPGLAFYRQAEEDLQKAADILWGSTTGASGERSVAKGRVIWGKSIEEVIANDRLLPDVEIRGTDKHTPLDWIHRHNEEAEVYFIANNSEEFLDHKIAFRVTNKSPELWNAVTGSIENLSGVREEGGRVIIPMKFAPRESFFIVFPQDRRNAPMPQAVAFPTLERLITLEGTWDVSFDPAWGAPAHVTFDHLQDWASYPDDGVRHYSGEATYRKTFSVRHSGKKRSFLDLGGVKNVAQVYLNGSDLGVVWTSPWRVEITNTLKQGENELRIEVVNLWPNRLIKDATLPKEQRLTKTNVRTYDTILPKDVSIHADPADEERMKAGKPAELFPSGLFGPVTIQVEAA